MNNPGIFAKNTAEQCRYLAHRRDLPKPTWALHLSIRDRLWGGISFDSQLIPKPQTTIMKKFIILPIAIALISSSALSQTAVSENAKQNVSAYLAKAKKQKTAAWICLEAEPQLLQQ